MRINLGLLSITSLYSLAFFKKACLLSYPSKAAASFFCDTDFSPLVATHKSWPIVDLYIKSPVVLSLFGFSVKNAFVKPAILFFASFIFTNFFVVLMF